METVVKLLRNVYFNLKNFKNRAHENNRDHSSILRDLSISEKEGLERNRYIGISE